jgi:arylsulfatase A-like enzyme
MSDTREDPQSAPEGEQSSSGLNRREFLGALGAAAAAGAFLGRGGDEAQGQQATYWFYDSFGNVVPVDPAVIAAGIYPPPLPEGVTPPLPGAPATPGVTCGSTYVTGAYRQPNILLIMVDQMRYPRWLTQSQRDTFNAKIMPNVYGTTGLASRSSSFENYFVAANSCTPSRCALLTGLYPQQTSMFSTEGIKTAPALQPWNSGSGFPTIGDVLRQSLNINCDSGVLSTPYDTAWIGKWHVSDVDFTNIGATGPNAYGFSSQYNIPTPSGGLPDNPYPNTSVGYPSPNGTQNEGAGGDTLGNAIAPWVPRFTYNILATPPDPLDVNDNTLNIQQYPAPYYQLSDAAIYHAFKEYWLVGHPNTLTTPWFLGLSFINPHDITFFPYGFGLATNASGQYCGSGYDFGCNPPNAITAGYFPPPVLGWTDNSISTDQIPFNGLPYLLYNATTNTAPPDWNNADDPESQPYNASGIPGGKPGLQAYFENFIEDQSGTINTAEGWCIFLNYYYWMQSLVDTLIGNVLTKVSSTFTGPAQPVIIFTSDHGDYGGSHNLHSKGGALYDEAYNVPLLIQLKTQTNAFSITYTCSAVDILPFIYSLALGNETWRSASGDMINYLDERESIFDALLNLNAIQRRKALVPNAAGGMQSLPYVLFTTDEYEYADATQWNNASIHEPGHATAFRTVDKSYVVHGSNDTNNFYGGGKLGMYTYWLQETTYPNTAAGLTQFEFYDYYANNYGETGNDAFQSGNWNTATAGAYLTAYNNIMAAELYNIYPQISIAHNTGFTTYMDYVHTPTGNYQSYPPNTIPPP